MFKSSYIHGVFNFSGTWKDKCFCYISRVKFLFVCYLKLFVICQFCEFDLLKSTKQWNLQNNYSAPDALSLLTCPPCIASVLNIRGWCSLPRAEASRALGTVPIGLCATLYPIRQTSVQLSLVILVMSVPSLHPSLPYSPSPSPSDSSVPISPPSSTAACPALIPSISIISWYRHFLDRRSPISDTIPW